MTTESVLRDYVDEESDDLLLDLQKKVEGDGYSSAGVSQEALMLEILAHAQVKVLAIMCERTGHSNLALAYMQSGRAATKAVKRYTLKGMGR